MSDAAEKGSVMLYGVSLAYEESAGDRGVQHGIARAFSMRGGSSFVPIRLSALAIRLSTVHVCFRWVAPRSRGISAC
jgi:hypothetical protein